MGVSCVKVYDCKVFWVLWVLRKTQCTFPAADQKYCSPGCLCPHLSREASRNPGEKALDVLPSSLSEYSLWQYQPTFPIGMGS